jgi:hypothetical protein
MSPARIKPMRQGLFWLCVIHAAYYALTGIWPLVSIQSFMAVTGPKRDVWLVRTVGVLVTAIAVPFALSAGKGEYPAEVFALALGGSAGLMSIDVVYVLAGVIAPIYLADAVAEAALIAAWIVLWLPW